MASRKAESKLAKTLKPFLESGKFKVRTKYNSPVRRKKQLNANSDHLKAMYRSVDMDTMMLEQFN